MDAIKNYRFDLAGYSKELKCYAHDFSIVQPDIEKFPNYRDAFYTFILVEEGNINLRVNGFNLNVKPNTIICGLPGELWEWPDGCDIKAKILCFEPEFLLSILKDSQLLYKCSFLEKASHHPLITLSEKGYTWINDILDEIISAILPSARHFDLLKAQLWHLILLIETEYKKNEKHNVSLPTNNYTAAFIDLVGTELYRHHNVAFYADHLCITPNYLNKITKKALGVSASTYIQNRILSEAKILLKITELNINEIAQSLGFESANYFIRFFKKNLGITPGEYRKNL